MRFCRWTDAKGKTFYTRGAEIWVERETSERPRRCVPPFDWTDEDIEALCDRQV